jgi:hypothetical protein
MFTIAEQGIHDKNTEVFLAFGTHANGAPWLRISTGDHKITTAQFNTNGDLLSLTEMNPAPDLDESPTPTPTPTYVDNPGPLPPLPSQPDKGTAKVPAWSYTGEPLASPTTEV